MADLRDFGSATRRVVPPQFSANIFAEIGLDRYVVATSALGDVYLAWSARGVSAVRLAGDEAAFEA